MLRIALRVRLRRRLASLPTASAQDDTRGAYDFKKASLVQREVAFSQENDGGIVKDLSCIKQSLSRLWRQLPLHKGAFLYSSVFFIDNHCPYGNKYKNTAYPFEICRIFAKLSFRERLLRACFLILFRVHFGLASVNSTASRHEMPPSPTVRKKYSFSACRR